MVYVMAVAVLGVVLLQAAGAVPASSVGGPMAIAFAIFAGALAVAIQEALTRKRGALGWIVNLAISFLGALVVAPLAGFVMVLALSPFLDGSSSLAAAGGPALYVSLAGVMALTLLGCRGALWLANRRR